MSAGSGFQGHITANRIRAILDAATASPSESEIEARIDLAEALVLDYESGATTNAQNLRTAVGILETALSQLHVRSTLRPVVLCRLCYAHTSEYLTSGSQLALDEAVRCGRLARNEGRDHEFAESGWGKQFDCYSSTLNNLGVALSHRAQRVLGAKDGDNGSPQARAALRDLDEAIEFARENKMMLEDVGAPSDTAAINLASRLLTRGSKRETHAVDHTEALQLFREIRDMAPATSATHATACLQIGNLETEAFKRTRNLAALDAALPAMEASVRQMPESSEMFSRANYMMQSAYLDRHEHTGDAADFVKALRFSARTLDARSISQAARDQFLLSHMRLLHRFALFTTSLVELDEFDRQAAMHLSKIPRGSRDEFQCHRLHSAVVLKKYLLSKQLEDLDSAILIVYRLLHDQSGYLFVNGRRGQMKIDGYYKLRLLVARLVRMSPSPATEVACNAIHACLSSACRPPDPVLRLMELAVDAVRVLEIYERCAGTGEVITREIAERRAAEVREMNVTELRERLLKSNPPPESAAAAGHRAEQTVDFKGPISAVYGFDLNEPMSSQQFAARLGEAERQSVERAKVEGKHPNPRLCLVCRSLKLLKPIQSESRDGRDAAFEWNPDMAFIPLATWDQLRRRKNCSICRLVLSLIATDSETESALEVLHPRLANADPKSQATDLYVSENQHTGERVLTVQYSQRIVGHIRILPAKKPVSISAYLEAQLAPRSSRKSPTGASRKVDLEVLRAWLDDCQLRHTQEDCNRPTIPSEGRYIFGTPLVLIDVLQRRLVSLTSTRKYFALSYVRGSVDLSNTLRANYASRCEPEGLPSELPATFEDAISLVRSIGERYLWIDALCIIQDDKPLKDKAFGLMDVVFRNAFATIVALSSKNASGGILGVETPWCRPERKEILTIDVGSSDLEWTPDPPQERNKGVQKVTLELTTTPPRLDLAVAMSEWDKRGWTYQEQLLSRRCLYFSDRSVYFRCGAYILSDGDVNGPVRPVAAWWGGREEAVVENTLSKTLSDGGDTPRLMGEKKRTEEMLEAYAKAVERYTNRQLSHDEDIINAFSGLLELLSTAYKTDHWCGLPSSALDHALLWTPAGKTYRRGLEYLLPGRSERLSDRPPRAIVPTNRGTVQAVYGPSEVTTLAEKIDRRFPSWSWPGWKGPVDYRLFSAMRDDEPQAVSLVDKFAINLEGAKLRFSRIAAASLDQGQSTSENQQFQPSPSLPNVLQFLAPSVRLTAFTISQEVEYMASNGAAHVPSRQGVRAILDRRGKRCGLWWEQAGYVYVGRGLSPEAEAKMLLVGVSRHKDARRPRSGPRKTKEASVTLFDDEEYPDVGRGSGLVNILAVDLDMGHEFGERITVARIHEMAWKEARPSMTMIRLA